jgi:hypothetical protein
MSLLKSTYSILPEHNLIIEIHKGELDVDSYINFKKKLSKDPDFKANMNNLIDHKKVVFKTNPTDVQKFVDFIKNNANTLGKRKVALLTETPNQVVSTTIYKTMQAGIKQEVEIFSTSNAAINWLLKKPMTSQLKIIISNLEKSI